MPRSSRGPAATPTLNGSPSTPPACATRSTDVRPLHIARLDKARPVLVLTRELVRPHLRTVTVAPVTTTARGLSTEVPVGAANGLDRPSVISCDNITTI